MASEMSFRVPGLPITQGSMVSAGRGMRHSNSDLLDWREKIGWIAIQARPTGWPSISNGEQAFGVELGFFLARPAYLPRRVLYPVKKRDVDKLLRAVLDALSGVLWRDDGQVIDVVVRKRFAVDPGVEARVTLL